jgi:hypothetical protein
MVNQIWKQYRQFPGGDLISTPTVTYIIAEFYSCICSLQLFALHVSPVSSSHNTAIKWCLHQCSHKFIQTGEKWKHTQVFYVYR